MTDPLFRPRHGLRYRWWRDIPWNIIATVIAIIMLLGFAILILSAWFFDMKPGDLSW